MLDWEGHMTHKRRQLDNTLHLISSSDYELQVDKATVSSFSTYNATDSIPFFINDEFSAFAQALGHNAEILKFSTGIGSSSTYIDGSCDLFLPDISPTSSIHSTSASKPHSISADHLSKIWNIKPDLAKKAINQTTQLYRQGANNHLSRHFSTNDRMLRYKRINSQFFTDTFYITAKGKSSRGNTCAQLFVSDKGYVAIYPMSSKSQYKDALHLFCKEIGVPISLIVDPSGEQTSKAARNFCNQVGTTLRILEESTQWANRAELYIGLFKESIRQDLSRTNSPMKFWDYCAERRARIHNVIPHDLFQLNGNNPTTATFGTQDDISNICQFDWYDWCYFREESHVQFPFQKRQLGRILGPLKNKGNEMAQAVLTITGKVVPRRSCVPLTSDEINNEAEKTKRDKFDSAILTLFGDSMSIPADLPVPVEFDLTDITDDEIDAPLLLEPEDPLDGDGHAIFERPLNDVLIHADVLLPQGEQLHNATVQG
jgi:hypothetical protein